MCDDDCWVWGLLFVIFLGGLIVGLFIPRNSDGRNTDSFQTYKNTLDASNIEVVQKELVSYDYEEVTFAKFLLLLKTANATSCYYDEGSFIGFRAEKLWFQYDGIYYEVRS